MHPLESFRWLANAGVVVVSRCRQSMVLSSQFLSLIPVTSRCRQARLYLGVGKVCSLQFDKLAFTFLFRFLNVEGRA